TPRKPAPRGCGSGGRRGSSDRQEHGPPVALASRHRPSRTGGVAARSRKHCEASAFAQEGWWIQRSNLPDQRDFEIGPILHLKSRNPEILNWTGAWLVQSQISGFRD